MWQQRQPQPQPSDITEDAVILLATTACSLALRYWTVKIGVVAPAAAMAAAMRLLAISLTEAAK